MREGETREKKMERVRKRDVVKYIESQKERRRERESLDE